MQSQTNRTMDLFFFLSRKLSTMNQRVHRDLKPYLTVMKIKKLGKISASWLFLSSTPSNPFPLIWSLSSFTKITSSIFNGAKILGLRSWMPYISWLISIVNTDMVNCFWSLHNITHNSVDGMTPNIMSIQASHPNVVESLTMHSTE